MGMTLWIHTLQGREMSDNSDDHSVTYRLADQLDAICEEIGIPKLSSFFDSTDLELNMSDDVDDEQEPDPETGYAYGIDDMQWFDAAEGLSVIRKLRAHLESSTLEVDEEEKSMLIEELDDFIAQLEVPASNGGKFNLPILM